MRRILVLLTLVFIVFNQLNCASNSNQPAAGGANRQSPSGTGSANASPAIAITAADLIESYRMVGADGAGKYKGQTLAVTGTVSRAGKDYLNRPYVNLKADNPVIEVHCTYNDAENEPMSALKEGQQVTIRGVCDGRLSTWVVLKDSVLQ